MQGKATAAQQQAYQKKLLQQQQQQMSRFHSPNSVDGSSGPVMTQSPIQMSMSGMIPQGGPSTLQMPPRQTSMQSFSGGGNNRMGPPGLTGPSPSTGFNTQQISPIPATESATYFGPGAGLSRLHQYAEGLKEGPDRETSEYWKAFVEEFFLPQAKMHLVLWNPTTREHKGFEVPASVVARWMQTNYISGVLSSNLSFESPREYLSGQPFPPPPRTIRADYHLPSGNVTHFVESKRCLLINNFDNGWQVQMSGLIRAAFVPHTKLRPSTIGLNEPPTLQTHLRLECLEILIFSHRSYIPSTVTYMQVKEEAIPQRIVKNILSSNGQVNKDADRVKSAKSEEESNTTDEDKSDFSIPINRLCLPDSPVNEYGITLRAMRCLEITESVCQLRDLMDFSMRERDKQAGPIDALRRLTVQYRERETQLQRSGLLTGNALGFDVNSSASISGFHRDGNSNHFMNGTMSEFEASANTNKAAQQPQQNGTPGGRSAPTPSPKLPANKRSR